MASRSVSVSEVLDSVPFGIYQIMVGVLCFCCTMFDGFDLTVIGVMVPKIAESLHLKPQNLAYAISAGQFGPLLGAAFLGMLADRVGRKRMLVACALGFGIFTTACAFITSVPQLALFRFLAGLGMGGAVPTAIAFGTEFAPSRSRATLATAMYAGVPFGAMLSGLSAVYVLPVYGWQTLFLIGGIMPLVIAVLMAFFLPESMTFLVGHEKGQAKVRKIVARIAPALAREKGVVFCSSEKKKGGVPLKRLFVENRAATTVLLWICFFIGYYLIYLLQSWAPTLLKKSGATIQQYSLAAAFINFGSAVATMAVGRLMDRAKNPYRVLQVGFVLGFLSMIAFGYFASSPFYIIASTAVLCGLFVLGTVSGLVALVTLSYPAEVTGSAVGWAYAVGRGGSTLAPLVGGLFIAYNWSVLKICGLNALGALVIIGFIAILASHSARTRKTLPEPVLSSSAEAA